MKWDMNIQSGITDLDLVSPILERKKPLKRFILTSGLVHILTASAILVTNQTRPLDDQKDLVEIEVAAGPASAPISAPIPEQAAPQETAALPQTPEPAAAPQPVVASQEPEPKTVAIAKQPAIKAKSIPVVTPKSSSQVEPLAKSQEISEEKSEPTLPVVATALETPTDENSEVPVKVAPKNEAAEVEKAVAAAREKQIEAAAADLDQETDKAKSALAETSDSVNEELQKENEAAAAKIAARSEALKKEQEEKAAQLAAQKEAQEKAEAAKLAAAKIAAEKAEAARQAAEAQKAAEAQAAAQAGAGQGTQNAGPGPVASEVRALEQLRQMPGNPKPLYDSEERLKGHMGVVVFQAFVTQDGQLKDFKLLKSTGYRNLDAKTLKALKQWKFYPGQEGWVELPFDWNLKGGPQEMPTYLRRKVGQSN